MLSAMIGFLALAGIAVFFAFAFLCLCYVGLVSQASEVFIVAVIVALLCLAFGWAAYANMPFQCTMLVMSPG